MFEQCNIFFNRYILIEFPKYEFPKYEFPEYEFPKYEYLTLISLHETIVIYSKYVHSIAADF